ncbi:MAG: PKD domain-containing protein, partial [Bacteroidota bacterium]
VGAIDLPEAAFSTSEVEGTGPLTVTFSGSSDTQPATATWEWIFEGGNPASSFDQEVSVTYVDTGRYDVVLIVSNGAGYDTLVSPGLVQVTALAPTAAFSATPAQGDFPLTVSFSDESTYVPTSWAWEFPGGTPSSSTEQNPEVVYNTPGNYSVTLTVNNAAGSDVVSESNAITVTRPPLVPAFSAADPVGNVPFTVQFADESTGHPVTWSWSFPGGVPATSTEQNPSVNYSDIGEYDVTLVITNAIGEQETLTKRKYVQALPPAPEIAFVASDSAGTAPFTVTFTDLSTNDPTSWLWEFPGGTPQVSTEQNPTVTYFGGGTFPVTLTASNAGGTRTRTVTGLITVEVIPPEAAFSVSDPQGVAPFTVQFQDETANVPTSWQWSFEGGVPATSTEQNPTVTFPKAGSFAVTLLVTNEAGNDVITQDDFVTVEYITPVADFSADARQGPAPFSVSFTDLSQFAPQSWSWEFPGGTPASSTEQNPQVQYTEPGVYPVTLRATNDAGTGTLERIEYITVQLPLPVVEFTADVTMGEAPLTVVFSNQTTGAASYAWELTGGSPSQSTEENPVVIYEEAGNWSVLLTATNADGGRAQRLKPAYIQVSEVTALPDPEPAELTVYPNPSRGAVTVRLAEPPEGPVNLRLIDLHGRSLREQRVDYVAGKEIAWMLSSVPQGLYLLEVTGEEGRLGVGKVLFQ